MPAVNPPGNDIGPLTVNLSAVMVPKVPELEFKLELDIVPAVNLPLTVKLLTVDGHVPTTVVLFSWGAGVEDESLPAGGDT